MQIKGTVNDSRAPWETYSAQFDEKLDPKLEAEINEYAKHRHEQSSNQNEEELCRQKEINYELGKQYRWVSPEEYADEGPRIGRIIHSSEFINILRNKCGLKTWYRQHPQERKLTLLVSRDGGMTYEVACWAQQGFMPEYSMMRFDDHGIPLDEKFRGWRTCILQMILKNFISEEKATKVFGSATGPASYKFNSLLYEFRNRKVSVI